MESFVYNGNWFLQTIFVKGDPVGLPMNTIPKGNKWDNPSRLVCKTTRHFAGFHATTRKEVSMYCVPVWLENCQRLHSSNAVTARASIISKHSLNNQIRKLFVCVDTANGYKVLFRAPEVDEKNPDIARGLERSLTTHDDNLPALKTFFNADNREWREFS